MADEKLVEREMLTNSFVNGTDVTVGDVVQITESQANAWENLDRPACAEVGYLDKLAEQRAKAEQIRAEAEQAAHEATQDAARVRGLHAQGLSAEEPVNAGSAQDGPKVTKTDTARTARR